MAASVISRLRGKEEVGADALEQLETYLATLASRLDLVSLCPSLAETQAVEPEATQGEQDRSPMCV
jgi:hypothetical protein